jgi:hypothetical protein
MNTLTKFNEWYQSNIMERWPKHELGRNAMLDWYRQLNSFDELVLTDAVRKHYLDDEPRTPSLKKIYSYAKAVMRPTGQSPNSTGHVIEMRCTKAGWVSEGVVRSVHVAGININDEQLARTICGIIERYTKTYGGQWQAKMCKE